VDYKPRKRPPSDRETLAAQRRAEVIRIWSEGMTAKQLLAGSEVRHRSSIPSGDRNGKGTARTVAHNRPGGPLREPRKPGVTSPSTVGETTVEGLGFVVYSSQWMRMTLCSPAARKQFRPCRI
jgi:hypothetical protein